MIEATTNQNVRSVIETAHAERGAALRGVLSAIKSLF